jgi:TPR repeat protein
MSNSSTRPLRCKTIKVERALGEWSELVEHDLAAAMRWYEKAALAGHVRSEFTIAHLLLTEYPKRYGIRPLDIVLSWLKHAAQARNADALFVLGCVVSEGCDLTSELEDWSPEDFWLSAALQGHGPAQKRLRARRHPEMCAALSVPLRDDHVLR